ncbi:MAG TPA: MarR family transcriptional regulator [Planctomycetaceae bacterium]|nr:MarR family transcriptional regulator [Planctomycetaceae bacterium]
MAGISSSSEQHWHAHNPVISQRTEQAALPPAVSAERVVERVQSAAQCLKSRLAEHFQKFDLNEIRYAVLNLVHASSPHGCSQTDLAEHLEQSESSISTLVERMRTDDLIYRLRCKIDRRKRVLILTERGQLVLQRIKSCHRQLLEQMLQKFTEPQRIELIRLLSELTTHLNSDGQADALSHSREIPAPHILSHRPQNLSGAREDASNSTPD